MIKGYMGDVCFNGKLLKNHIIYIDGNRKIEKIAPFISECEGVILCDNILLVVNEGVEASQEKIRALKDEYNNSESYSVFFESLSYSQYGAKEIKEGITFIELDNTKPLCQENDCL